MEIEEYMFKLKISILGDKSVGKSAFLGCIENSFGDLVSSEETDELTLKVTDLTNRNKLTLNRLWHTWMTRPCTRSNTGSFQEA